LSEFDFLHHEDDPQHQLHHHHHQHQQQKQLHQQQSVNDDTVELTANNANAKDARMQIIIPQVSLPVDLLSPVLSMPPVVLMGGGQPGMRSSLYCGQIPQSPIVEMPPSPAPNQMPMVEFPEDDDVLVEEYDEINIVEVRVYSHYYFSNFPSLLTPVRSIFICSIRCL
jgi:hypothetical protein